MTSNQYDRYLSDRLANGWLVFDIIKVGLYGQDEIFNWMEKNVGTQHMGTDWGDPGVSSWEYLGSSKFLIRTKAQAMLTKVTWG